MDMNLRAESLVVPRLVECMELYRPSGPLPTISRSLYEYMMPKLGVFAFLGFAVPLPWLTLDKASRALDCGQSHSRDFTLPY